MELIIEQMFLRCFRDSCFEQAIGETEMDRRGEDDWVIKEGRG
jgi:hypothetical protein